MKSEVASAPPLETLFWHPYRHPTNGTIHSNVYRVRWHYWVGELQTKEQTKMIQQTKNPTMFEACLETARAGGFIKNGRLYVGASHRNYFWKGYHHHPITADDTLGYQCYLAGKQFRSETDKFVNLESTNRMYGFKDCK